MATTRFHMIVSYDRSILRQLNTSYWDYTVFAFCYKLIEEALICESLKRGLRKKVTLSVRCCYLQALEKKSLPVFQRQTSSIPVGAFLRKN